MGYGYYEINLPNGRPMKRGYGVLCKCHQRGCVARIDRGLGYLCYGCTYYFCGEHLTYSEEQFDCFAGRSEQCCLRCNRGLN